MVRIATIEIAPPVYERLRTTIPTREALLANGNTVERDGDGGGMWPTYRVTLVRPPPGIVLCLVGRGRDQGHALRMPDEPEYPGEWRQPIGPPKPPCPPHAFGCDVWDDAWMDGHGTPRPCSCGAAAQIEEWKALPEPATEPAGIAWHEFGAWVPCPTCGAALVWYEAGYVPGYRVCVRGHHAQLSADGRSARAM